MNSELIMKKYLFYVKLGFVLTTVFIACLLLMNVSALVNNRFMIILLLLLPGILYWSYRQLIRGRVERILYDACNPDLTITCIEHLKKSKGYDRALDIILAEAYYWNSMDQQASLILQDMKGLRCDALRMLLCLNSGDLHQAGILHERLRRASRKEYRFQMLDYDLKIARKNKDQDMMECCLMSMQQLPLTHLHDHYLTYSTGCYYEACGKKKEAAECFAQARGGREQSFTGMQLKEIQ